MEKLFEKYNVSRETIAKLKTYESSLVEWQNKFNLVSKSSLETAWNRHFLDSVQLWEYIPENARTMLDFGSGAGFPGMVLAIIAAEKQKELKISLVESIRKKTLYLKAVKELSGVSVNIINDRIENLSPQVADVITSRAMSKLENLFAYAYRFTNKNTVMIFPKGKSYSEEIKEAQKKWRFNCEIKDNLFDNEGKILVINNLSPIKGEK